MNTYLEIAERVLREARRPLTPRAILKEAYRTGLVPPHLHGSTQHKTLQARVSEDVLRRRDQSPFFRPKAGQFFLREFMQDPSIPAEMRREYIARRRSRELLKGPALSLTKADLSKFIAPNGLAPAERLLALLEHGAYSYVEPRLMPEASLLLWAAAFVVKGTHVLCYRIGKYRDDRDDFAHKRTLVFSSLVLERDRTIFDVSGLGIGEKALSSVLIDLDTPSVDLEGGQEFKQVIHSVAWANGSVANEAILAFTKVLAPKWFEPTRRRLSLNDLHWLDLSVVPNNLDDFDPWSKLLLHQHFSGSPSVSLYGPKPLPSGNHLSQD